MTAVAIALALFSLLLLVWSYLLYPKVIARLAAQVGPQAFGSDPPESLEVLLSAADEEAVIGDRVRNLLAQEGVPALRISIGCDGCSDATAERARSAGNERVQVREFSARRGKAAVLNDLMASSEADLLVFTDANTRFAPDAIARLAGAFADPAVGAVCGRLILDADGRGDVPESLFWDRETKLKEAEGRLGVCLGANGAIYAVRRDCVTPLPEDTTSMDDFLIPVRIARLGRKVVFAPDAVAREPAGRDVASEVARRFRIGIGAGQVLRRETWLWNFRRHGALSLGFLSRKVARWVGPVLALAAAIVALFDPLLRPAGILVLSAAFLLLLLTRLRLRVPGAVGRLYYFGVINVALAAGVVAGLAGYRRPAWRRTAR